MTNLLIVLIIFLALVAFVQLVRVLELSAEIRGVNTGEVTDEDNNTQGILMFASVILLLGAFFTMTIKYWDLLLPKAASIHGAETDTLMAVSMALIIFVFVIIQPIMFYFAYKYRGNKKNKALFYAHNNKLEVIWTIIPSIVLTVLIFYGLNTWGKIVNTDTSDAIVIELYGKQFQWDARYSGEDNELGVANVRLIEGTNVLGLDIEDEKSWDDIVTSELHLPVNKKILFKFRSQDIIHSAYMPHFRLQMNCVPGMVTQFAFTPTMTTEEMRQETLNPDFEYVLLCNKICGAAHYNMQMRIVVESEEDYNKWLKEKTIFQNL